MSDPDLKAIDLVGAEAAADARADQEQAQAQAEADVNNPRQDLARRNRDCLMAVMPPMRDGAANWRYPTLRETVKDPLIEGFADAWGQGFAKYDIDLEEVGSLWAIELACLYTAYQLGRAVNYAIMTDDAARARAAKDAAAPGQGAGPQGKAGSARPAGREPAKSVDDPNLAGVARRDEAS